MTLYIPKSSWQCTFKTSLTSHNDHTLGFHAPSFVDLHFRNLSSSPRQGKCIKIVICRDCKSIYFCSNIRYAPSLFRYSVLFHLALQPLPNHLRYLSTWDKRMLTQNQSLTLSVTISLSEFRLIHSFYLFTLVCFASYTLQQMQQLISYVRSLRAEYRR